MNHKKMVRGSDICKKSIVLLGMVVLFLGLSGCGKEKDAEGQNRNGSGESQSVSDAENGTQSGAIELSAAEGNYYTGEYVTIPETEAIERIAVSDTAVYYLKYDQSDNLKGKLMKYDLDSGQTTDLTDAIPAGSIQGLCVNSEGHPLLILINAEEERADQLRHWLIEIGEDGTVMMEKDLTGLLEESEEEYFLRYLKAGPDGRIYLAGNETVWVLDREGNEEFHVQSGEWIYEMGVLPEGKLAISVYGMGSMLVKVLDCEKKDWGDTYENDHFRSPMSFTEPGEGGIYFYNSNELYSYDPKTGETAVVADWLYHDIYVEDIVYLSVREDGLHLITCDRDAGRNEMAVLKQTDKGEKKEKQMITLGTIELTNGLRGCVTNFNKENDNYRIEVIEYAKGTNYSAGVMRFNNEIIAGNIPDIINITDGTEEFYAAKGIFEDLKPYLDGEQGINRADYFDNILTALETDGKLYFLSPDFYIDTIVGKTGEIGDGYSWTIEEMRKLAEERREGVELLNGETKSGILNIYLRYNMAQFFDLNEGYCAFDNDAFKEMLEFANCFPTKSLTEEWEIDWERARNGEVLLMESTLRGISDYQLCHNIFDADISFVGYPGSFACGSVAKGGPVTIAMNAKSGNKEGAWEFIRSLLEEDYQNQYVNFFPLLRSAFDRMADAAMQSTLRTNEDGDKINGGESITVSIQVSTPLGEPNTFSVDIHPAKEEEIAEVRGLIEAIDRMARFDETVLSIVSEESAAYFNGQKSVEEVISVIQSRVNIYMNENR